MSRLLRGFCILLLIVLSSTLLAQDETRLRLDLAETALATGQTYSVTISVENVSELWLVSLTLQYDPNQLYIIGTESGTPVEPGELLTNQESIVLSNQIDGNTLHYLQSLVNPAEPVDGSGVLGTFEIVPLQAGETQLFFQQAQFAKANFVEQDGQRIAEGGEAIPFTPILVNLTLQGDPASPPPEVSATPTMTPTIAEVNRGEFATEEPTLVNVTAPPLTTATPEPLTTIPLPNDVAEDNSNGLVVIPILLIVIAVIGLLGLFIWQRRK